MWWWLGTSEVLKCLVQNWCSASGHCGFCYSTTLSTAHDLLLLRDCFHGPQSRGWRALWQCHSWMPHRHISCLVTLPRRAVCLSSSFRALNKKEKCSALEVVSKWMAIESICVTMLPGWTVAGPTGLPRAVGAFSAMTPGLGLESKRSGKEHSESCRRYCSLQMPIWYTLLSA